MTAERDPNPGRGSAPKSPPDSEPPLPKQALLKIGEFARLAGTNLRTLRYYEEIGLLEPARRSKGGFRYYRTTDVNRLRMVQTLQELGLHLDRIGELMDTRDQELTHREHLDRVREALVEQDRLLMERTRSIEEQREKIRQALEKLGECENCQFHPKAENNYCEPCSLDGGPLPEDLSALF